MSDGVRTVGKAQQNTAKLTDKQRAFVNEYFLCGFNATEAASRAGYSGDNSTLRSVGSENLTKPNIRDEIQKRLEQHAMEANEAIARLALMARGDLVDLLNEDGTFDFAEAKRRGTTYLIREYERIEEKDGKVRTKVKLEDRQAAINTLIKELHLKADEPTERAEQIIRVQPVDYREAIKGLAPKDDE